MRWPWRSPVEREDVNAALAALFDIRHEVNRIRTILDEDDGEEGEAS